MTPLQLSQKKWHHILDTVREWEGAPIYKRAGRYGSPYSTSFIIAGEWFNTSSSTCALCQAYQCDECPVAEFDEEDEKNIHGGCEDTPYEEVVRRLRQDTHVTSRLTNAVEGECDFLDSLEEPEE